MRRFSPWRPLLPAVVIGTLVGGGLVAWMLVAQLGAPVGHRLVDLAVYRAAGRSVLDGRAVYSHLTAAPQRLAFTYPPFAAVAAVPLAWLSFGLAGWLWTAGELVCTVAITWYGFRRLLPAAGRYWPAVLGGLAGLMQQLLPLRDEIRFGQVDELVVVLCLLDCVVARPRWPRGVLVGVATAVKLTPGVFIPYLWLTGRRRAAAVAGVTVVTLELLSAALLPGDSRAYWTDALWHTGRLQPNDGTSNQSLRGMLLRAGLPHVGFVILLGCALLIAGVVGFRRAAGASTDGDEVAGVALTGLLAVLLSPVAWIHHLVWLPLVLGVLVDRGRSPRRVAAATAGYLFVVARIPWDGRHLLQTAVPTAIARLVEDGFGLMAVGLLIFLPWRRPDPAITGQAVESAPDNRHDVGQRTQAHASARATHRLGLTGRGEP